MLRPLRCPKTLSGASRPANKLQRRNMGRRGDVATDNINRPWSDLNQRPWRTSRHCHRQVEIRVNEDAPSYPSTVDSSLVPVGKIPLGSNAASSSGVPYDPRPSSEGGCSAGHFEGCRIYNIKVCLLSPRLAVATTLMPVLMAVSVALEV